MPMVKCMRACGVRTNVTGLGTSNTRMVISTVESGLMGNSMVNPFYFAVRHVSPYMLTGKGKMTFEDGHIYEGDFLDDARTGNGVYRWSENEYYSGDFADGVYHGRGVFRYANGDEYDGEWVNGYKHGRGIMRYADGSVFEGDFYHES